jgi:glyoxylase-like metal-dependent hydrolase (beta-lactamase superfamily II)
MWDPSEPPDVDVEDAAGPGADAPPDRAPPHGRRFPWEPTPWGGPGIDVPWRHRVALRATARFPRLLRAPVPTRRLDDAGTIRLAGRDWVAVHTPGHTDDHLCLFDPAVGVMLSGDHVLPTITPHISGLVADPDPLARFYDSLDKVAAYGADVSVVLPAHGHPFSNLVGRVAEIKQHHDARLERLRQAAAGLDRPAGVTEFSTHLFSARVQGPMADSETFAHLEHLRRSGEMDRSGERSFHYVLR